MRIWCSVSDRCSATIGEGKVPPASSSCVYTLCAEQRRLVISAMIDAAAEEWLERIYMKLWWGGQREQAVLSCHYFFFAHSAALAPAKQECCNTTGQLQRFPVWWNHFPLLGMIQACGPGLPDTITPEHIARRLRATFQLRLGEITLQWRHLLSLMFVSLWSANDE